MKLKIICFLVIFTNFLFASQQEINREERRRKEEEFKKIEKEDSFNNKYPTNELDNITSEVGSEIKIIEVKGNTILSKNKIENLKKKYVGKRGGKNVINFVKELENLYLEKGYITTRVKIDIENSNFKAGKIQCIVIEGYIENIVMNGESNNSKIFASFPTKEKEVLNIKDLDQGIDNLNSISANNAKLDILAGENLGGSIIDIKNETSKKISAAVNYNNLGQKSTGEERIKLALTIEDFLGINDSFTGSYQRKLGRNKKYNDNENFSFYYLSLIHI